MTVADHFQKDFLCKRGCLKRFSLQCHLTWDPQYVNLVGPLYVSCTKRKLKCRYRGDDLSVVCYRWINQAIVLFTSVVTL